MKIVKLLVLSAVAFVCSTANAQTDGTLQFVDKNGNVVPDGSTITVTEVEDDGMGSMLISTGLSIKNTTDKNVGSNAEFTISQLDNGSIACCYPMQCKQLSSTGTYETVEGTLAANETRNFLTEWYIGGEGKAVVTFKLKVYELVGNPLFPEYEFKGYGPSVTVNFVYEPSGIGNVDADDDKTITGIYTIGGQQIEQFQKGINIVKYSNGKSAKIVVK